VTFWIAFQIVFDIIIFLFIIMLVVRQGKARGSLPRYDELKTLVEDFKSAVEKSEKVARELDAQMGMRRTALSTNAPRAAQPAAKPAVNVAPVADAVEDHKRKVAALHRQGMPKEEISRRLVIPLPEVELIVAMLSAND